MNQIEIDRHHYQTGHPSRTFVSVYHLIQRIRAYVEDGNATAEPFVWTTTAEDILAKVRLVQTNVKKLVQTGSK